MDNRVSPKQPTKIQNTFKHLDFKYNGSGEIPIVDVSIIVTKFNISLNLFQSVEIDDGHIKKNIQVALETLSHWDLNIGNMQ